MSKILIIDDEPKILQILDKIVRKQNHETILGTNGEEGVNLANKFLPDLILSDVYMPKVTGLELCRKLKLSRNTAKIPIIIITASDESPDLMKIFEYGADAWIKKPFKINQILGTIEEVKQEQKLLEKHKVLGDWIDFKLKSTEDILKSLNLFIENLLTHTSLSETGIQQFSFAINEMIMNALEHGNHFELNKHVTLSYVVFAEKLIIKIRDEGMGFIPKSVADPLENPVKVAATRASQGKRPGGYGISLSKKYVDEIKYNEKGNEILMTKFFDTT